MARVATVLRFALVAAAFAAIASCGGGRAVAGTPDVPLACLFVFSSDSKGRYLICRDMKTCRETGDPLRCEVYCGRELQGTDLFWGLELGPLSATCLGYFKRVKGNGWVEAAGSSRNGSDQQQLFAFRCIDKRGQVAFESHHASCTPDGKTCTRGTVGRPEEPMPRDVLLKAICSEQRLD